jgi:hypothetical protein
MLPWKPLFQNSDAPVCLILINTRQVNAFLREWKQPPKRCRECGTELKQHQKMYCRKHKRGKIYADTITPCNKNHCARN